MVLFEIPTKAPKGAFVLSAPFVASRHFPIGAEFLFSLRKIPRLGRGGPRKRWGGLLTIINIMLYPNQHIIHITLYINIGYTQYEYPQ